MLKTCYNCTHYHTVCDSEDHDCHWHDFCGYWGKLLDGWNYYTIRLGEGVVLDKEFDIVYDDFETGRAECYMFSSASKEFRPDEWFLKNREYNDRLKEAWEKAQECPDDCPGKIDENWCLDNECPK